MNYIKNLYAVIPSELTELDRWVYFDNNKHPFYLNGDRKIKKEWQYNTKDFETACEEFEKAQKLGAVGLGFYFAREDNLVGIDLDDCVISNSTDGIKLDSKTVDILRSLDRTAYVELSKSKKGIHIVGKCNTPTTIKQEGVEVYTSNRYFAITGDVLTGFKNDDFLVDLTSLVNNLKVEHVTKESLGTVPVVEITTIPESMRHNTLLAKAVNLVRAGETDPAWLCNYLESVAKKCRQSELFQEGGSRHQELKDIVKWAIKTVENDGMAIADVVEAEGLEPEQSFFEVPASLIDGIPGIASEMIDFILSYARRSQPVLAMGASLATLSILKNSRYRTEDNGRGNILLAHVAPSGSGKDHPQKVVRRFLKSAGCSYLAGGIPASSTALFNLLHRAPTHSKLVIWDEFGKELESFSRSNAQSYESTIFPEIMRLFSQSSHEFVSGKEYANADGKRPTLQLDNPYLSILGSTTAESFYNAVTYESAKDGFLPRWIILQPSVEYPELNLDVGHPRVPAVLSDYFRTLCPKISLSDEEGNLQGVLRETVTVPYSPKAKRLLKDWSEASTAQLKECGNEGERAIIARKVEQTIKIALVLADKQITERELLWAYDLVDCSMRGISELIERNNRIADPFRKRKIDKLLTAIRSAGKDGITQRNLLRSTRLRKDELVELLGNCIQTGEIRKENVKKPSGQNSVLYFILEDNKNG